jgi:hypothetical protein
MKPLTYKITKDTPGEYVIEYQETERRNKIIKFSFLQQYLHFVDLLKQAKYKQVPNN